MLGAIIGSTFLALVGGMTWFTISGLVYAAEKTGKTSYAAVVRTYASLRKHDILC